MTEQTPKKPSKWNKPEAADDNYPVEHLKAACEGVEGVRQTDQGAENHKLEFTAQDTIKAFNYGQWYGKRLGQLYSLQRTMPYIRKQNERIAKAGHKVGLLKQALRAQVEAGRLTAEAFDD